MISAKTVTNFYVLLSRGTLKSNEYGQEISREPNGRKNEQFRIHEKGKKESKIKSKCETKEKANTKLNYSNLLDEEHNFLAKLADLEHFNFEPDFKVNGKRFKDCKVDLDYSL